jgi:methyl-accepting chemotaxis protein
MNKAFKTILQVLKDLETDMQKLIDAAAEGSLSVRAEEEKHHGKFRRIVEGINATLDAMIGRSTSRRMCWVSSLTATLRQV